MLELNFNSKLCVPNNNLSTGMILSQVEDLFQAYWAKPVDSGACKMQVLVIKHRINLEFQEEILALEWDCRVENLTHHIKLV